MIGQTVSHYCIREQLGAGGMGEVYLAEDTRLGRRVALKLLTTELTTEADRLRRFESEARAASGLNHPNIVTIHDIGEADVGRFIVMEHVAGRTLREMIGPPVALETLLSIGRQAAEALGVAHAAGIVHRDVKPANIMVRDDGYVKLLDFGLVRLLPGGGSPPEEVTQTLSREIAEVPAEGQDSTATGVLLGTVTYMSPEQARAQRVTSATDVFSLGLVLYELAAGHHPFRASSNAATLHAIVGETTAAPSRLRPDLPAAVDALILRMLEKNPRNRPSAADVASTLDDRSHAPSAAKASVVLSLPARRTVGREGERVQMRAAFDAAASGHGSLICVTGEPGIGKTTLVEETLHELAASGNSCLIARGRCSERLAGTEAYLPIIEALESLLHGPQRVLVARTMKTLAPTWYLQLAPLAEADSSTERALADATIGSQERLKREFVTFVGELTNSYPLVVFFDDLHWADAASVDLIAYLAARFDRMRAIILSTYRPSELQLADHPMMKVKLELQGRGVCQEIGLGFLSRDDIDHFLTLEFPDHRFPDELSALIYGKTEGSPLFMTDLVRYLHDRGVIGEQDGQWCLDGSVSDVERSLPESVRSMIQRKIDQLEEADRDLLITASVHGPEFDTAVVSRAIEIDETHIEDRLEYLDRVHAFVRFEREHELPDGTLTVRYRFVHALYQNSLYALLRPARRAALSKAVGQALQTFYRADPEPVASQLALLFEAAREFDRAAEFFVLAARHACRRYAHDEAVALCARAVTSAGKLQGPAGQQLALEAALLRAEANFTLSRLEESSEDFAAAQEAARAAGDREAEVDAACGRAFSVLQTQQLAAGREHGRGARELARAAGWALGEAKAELVLASERLVSGYPEEAEQLYHRATSVLEQSTGPKLSWHDLYGVMNRSMVSIFRAEYDKAYRVIEWVENRTEAGSNVPVTLSLAFFRAFAFGQQGRIGEAMRCLVAARRTAELNGDRLWLSRYPNTQGWLHRELQDFETALQFDHESIPLARECGQLDAEAMARINLANTHCLLGEHDRAREQLREAERILNEDVKWMRWRYDTRFQAESAAYWIAVGDLPRAVPYIHACRDLADRTSQQKYRAWSRKLLGDVAVLEDRVGDARREYEASLSILRRYPCPTIEWRVLQAASQAARRTRDHDAADDLLHRAQAVVRSLASTVEDKRVRRTFEQSQAVRELGSLK